MRSEARVRAPERSFVRPDAPSLWGIGRSEPGRPGNFREDGDGAFLRAPFARSLVRSDAPGLGAIDRSEADRPGNFQRDGDGAFFSS